ncbi:hypothetical protein [Heliophilum fasciatum]|nr:hypothetical protein [Heliophilum fasciatum]MCW2278574.1 hypothetical protein [Heliophilum fasciatum]
MNNQKTCIGFGCHQLFLKQQIQAADGSGQWGIGDHTGDNDA